MVKLTSHNALSSTWEQSCFFLILTPAGGFRLLFIKPFPHVASQSPHSDHSDTSTQSANTKCKKLELCYKH